jgi:hypothetical protein
MDSMLDVEMECYGIVILESLSVIPFIPFQMPLIV